MSATQRLSDRDIRADDASVDGRDVGRARDVPDAQRRPEQALLADVVGRRGPGVEAGSRTGPGRAGAHQVEFSTATGCRS
jgi:hypothetical protein